MQKSLLLRLYGFTKPYKNWLWATVLLSLVLAPLALARPILVQTAVDSHIIKGDMAGMWVDILLLLCILMFESIFQFVFSITSSKLGQFIIHDTRQNLFRFLSRQNMSYFDQTPLGRSTTRIINDTETLSSVFSQGIIAATADILSLIVVLAYMFYQSWMLTLVCLSTIPFLLLATYFFKNGVKKSFEIVRNKVAEMNTFLQERISGMRIIQIFSAEKREIDNFGKIINDYKKANISANFHYAVFFPVVEILSAASLGLMIWYGAGEVLEGTATLGNLIAFPLYLNLLFRPIRVLADKFNTLQMGVIASKRIFELTDNEGFLEKSGGTEIQKLKGEISFERVRFKYQSEGEGKSNGWILDDVSFHVPPGSVFAIVGSTGSGKTTIISLINRLYELNEGQILMDGTPLTQIDLKSLRSRIAVILQDPFLFSGTIAENISLKNPACSMEQIIEAAKVVGAHDFIMALPGQYDYEVRERGVTLSMGQRQLIAFARALAVNPDILIMDEASANIDPESEALLQEATIKLIEGRTSIVIAHRLSTIQHADKILVMDGGKVAEQGTLQELLNKPNGVYRKLHELQFDVVG